MKRSANILRMDNISPTLVKIKSSSVYMPGQTHFGGQVSDSVGLFTYCRVLSNVYMPGQTHFGGQVSNSVGLFTYCRVLSSVYMSGQTHFGGQVSDSVGLFTYCRVLSKRCLELKLRSLSYCGETSL